MSAEITVKGNTGWVRQISSGSSDYAKASGEIITDTWEKGKATDAEIAAKKTELKQLGYESIRVTRGAPTVISASFPDTLNTSGSTAADLQAIADADWELIFNLIEQKVELNSDFQRNPFINELIAEIERLKDLNALAGTDLSTFKFSDGNVHNFNNNKLRDAIARGADSYYITERVLRQTITTSSKTLIQLSESNILKIHAPADIGVPAYFVRIFNLQPRYQYVAGEYRLLKWLKMPPQFIRVSKRKFQIIQEYWEINPDPYLYLAKDSETWPA